jgi:hypothetical protein
MHPREAQVADQGTAISGLLPNRERGGDTATPRIAAAVIRNYPVVVGDAGLHKQGGKRIRK